jgi:transposase-like protein
LINIDKSGGNTAAIQDDNDAHGKRIKIRQRKHLNNIVEQGRRPI